MRELREEVWRYLWLETWEIGELRIFGEKKERGKQESSTEAEHEHREEQRDKKDKKNI